MTSSGSPIFDSSLRPVDGLYVLRGDASSESTPSSFSESQTFTIKRSLSRFSLALPLAIGVLGVGSFGSPATSLRFYTDGRANRTLSGRSEWQDDVFLLTEEVSSDAQVLALNALLALPAIDGTRVDLH